MDPIFDVTYFRQGRAVGEQAAALALGIFDGVHLGHVQLLQRCKALARARAQLAVAVTFDPPPALVLRPLQAPANIEPLDVRLAHFAALGMDAAVVLRFDHAMAKMPADAFVHAILGDALFAHDVVVGHDFAFGRGQAGSFTTLQRLGARGVGKRAQTMAVHRVNAVTVGAEVASSTRVRNYVAAGEVAHAAQLLGRHFCLFGTVEQGLQRGRTLGFPTANLRQRGGLLPAFGIYAAWATGSFGRKMAAVSIGVHPTFDAAPVAKIEAYLLDYDGPAFYNTPLQLALVQRLRGEEKFDGAAALVAQMHHDCATARDILLRDDAAQPLATGAGPTG